MSNKKIIMKWDTNGKQVFRNTYLWKTRLDFEVFVSPKETNYTLAKTTVEMGDFKVSIETTHYTPNCKMQIIYTQTRSDSTKQTPSGTKDKQGKENKKKRCLLCNIGIKRLMPNDQ